MLKTRDKIITAQDLAQDITRAMHHAQQEPLIVTEAGRPAAYLISIELFDALLAQLETWEQAELTEAIERGEAQFAAGQFHTLAEATTLLEAKWQQERNGA